MADFVKFGSAVTELARRCGSNCSAAGVADFLALQQRAVQADRIKSRTSGGQKNGSQAGAGQQAPSSAAGEAAGAFQRMQALLGRK